MFAHPTTLSVVFSTLGLGPGPLELGKLATKLEIWEISHFNKPFRLEVCLKYSNNYNNKWMPVPLIGEIKYMITLHKKNILNFFFYEILGWEIFQAILGKFRGNSDWDWGRILAPNRVQKNPTDTTFHAQTLKIHYLNNQMLSLVFHAIWRSQALQKKYIACIS